MMIRLIEASYSCFFPREIDAMFRSRAKTFSERLGWDVVVKDGYERDSFDSLNPVYVVSVGAENRYLGSLRLLPTTGPNMLRDVFPQLLAEGEQVSDERILESSRISVAAWDGGPSAGRTDAGLNRTLCELLIGVGEFGMLAGFTKILSVFDARMLRILRATGSNPKVIGTPQRIGGVMCYAALFDVGPDALKSVRRVAGFDESVLAPGAYDWVSYAGEKTIGARIDCLKF